MIEQRISLQTLVQGAVGLTVAVFALLAFAAPTHAANNVSTGMTLLDTNNNGKIDRVSLSIDNDAAQTWVVNGTPTTAALSATMSGAALTISSVAINGSATADPVTVFINIDESDADLLTSTDGVTEAPLEVIYNDVDGTSTCTNCIRDDSGELTSWVTGDSVAADTEADLALPVVSAVAVTTNAISGITYNALSITYTENVKLSTDAGGDNDIAQGASGTSSTTLGDMTLAKTLTGFGSWNGTGDCAVSAAAVNTIASVDSTLLTVVTISFNTATAGYFSTCGTGPSTDTFTPVGDANDVRDFANNAVNGATKAMTVSTAWDVAAPTVSNTYSCDTDNDGDVNRLQVNMSESIIDAASNTVTFWEGDNDSANDGTGEEDAATWNTATGGCDGSADDTDANDQKFRIDLTAGVSGTDSAYVNLDTAGPRDWAGNRAATVAGGGTENDVARPVITAISPASGSTGSRDVNFTLTMSETAASCTGTASSGVTVVCSVSTTTITLNPSGSLNTGSNTITLATAPDAAANTLYGAVSGVTHPIVYTAVGTSGSSGSSSSSSSSTTYSMNVTTPATNDSYNAGDNMAIAWSYTGSGMNYVTIEYSTDGGDTWSAVATDVTNAGGYNWTVADVSTDEGMIRVTGSDLATDLATDTSGVFTIVGTTSADEEGEEADEEDEDENLADGSGEMGVSPVTGEPEEISVVSVGDYIVGASFDTVYYVDEGMIRRPFLDLQSFMTYEESFDDVLTVTDATLTSLTLGSPMLPKAGVVLVKIQSDARVYWVEENADGELELRWVTSESVATDMFGADWADYVVDVSVTLFPRYESGDDIDEAFSVDRAQMKTREEVNS